MNREVNKPKELTINPPKFLTVEEDVARGGVNQSYQLDLQANRITYDGAVKAAIQVRDAFFEAARLRALSTVVSAVGHNVARDMEQGLALRY